VPDPPDPALIKPPRLEKVDGRISHHERRYGQRRHDFANLLARAELDPPWRVNRSRSTGTSPLSV
jgi:hypothetical protein